MAGRFLSCGLALVGLAFIPASWLPELDPVVNFAHLFAAGFLVIFAIAALSRRRDWYVVAATALAAVGPGSLVAGEVIAAIATPHASGSRGLELKIVSANLWSGNRKFLAVRDFIQSEQPDIVLLQEAFWGGKAMLELVLPGYHVVAGCQYRHECNVVVLTRDLRAGPPEPYTPSHVTAHVQLTDGFGNVAIEVVSVHLSRPPPSEDQIKEIAEIEKTVSSFSDRAIVGGDFNATPWSSALRRLDSALPVRRVTRFLPSWPSSWPLAPIDHVFVGGYWQIAAVRQGPEIGSDHRPIMVTLRPR